MDAIGIRGEDKDFSINKKPPLPAQLIVGVRPGVKEKARLARAIYSNALIRTA